jgi:Domain of unknown function (DUF1905)/Bacteriocin-protection, YdeI or OmpD-Associated
VLEDAMPEKKLEFKVKLAGQEGTEVAAIIAPFDVLKTFGTRARVPVRGTINGFPYRSSLMPMDGCYAMVVNRTIREGAGIKAGDEVDVVMERDTEERTVEAPPELKKELAKSKKAQERWEKLSFTHKKEMARSITEAKQEETKKRRLAKVMQVLKTGAKWTG